MAQEKRDKFNKLTIQQKKRMGILGVMGQTVVQAQCSREDLPSENIIGRNVDGNAFIVMGRDRPGKRTSGRGGSGESHCDTIDICAGYGSRDVKEVETIKDEAGKRVESKLHTNPNFFVDAARIYISQKTDVDENFGIGEFASGLSHPPSREGPHAGKSAVAVKADNIRIVGRESIRIVTGTDSKNSQGGDSIGKTGVELIAMNDISKLQPIPLGDNLQELLMRMIRKNEALAKVVHAWMKYQLKFNQALATHTHLSPFFALPTTPSEAAVAAGTQQMVEQTTKTELSMLKHLTNLAGIKHNYLSESGDKYINSELNKVN